MFLSETGVAAENGKWNIAGASEALRWPTFDTSPYNPTTHWQQLYFPFENPINLRENEDVNFLLKAERNRDNSKLLEFSWDVKSEVLE